MKTGSIRALGFIAICVLGSVAAVAAPVTIGGPGNSFDGDCAPFGCALEYQQIYGSGMFSGLISIGEITFFNNNFVPGSIAAANYSISLSTTSVAVDGLSSTFADNVGGDNQLFFSGALGGLIGASNQFTITGTTFEYDPSLGNLIMTVTKDGGEFDFSVFLDYASNTPSGTFSRAYSFGNSGIAEGIDNGTGLVTRFASTATSVPEPTSLLLLSMGLLGACAVKLAQSQFMIVRRRSVE